jgi:hypothetical protein
MPAPNEPSQPLNRSVSIARGFALVLETACEDFEICQQLIRNEISVVPSSDREHYKYLRASPRIQMALAKSFVFNVVRARRICEHGHGLLAVDRLERKRFMSATAGVTPIRDVNEHGFDASGGYSRPSMHNHVDHRALVDDTALAILGATTILMGPLNLYDVYVSTDRMRRLAGFANLAVSGNTASTVA